MRDSLSLRVDNVEALIPQAGELVFLTVPLCADDETDGRSSEVFTIPPFF
jgi:hypothetical protein